MRERIAAKHEQQRIADVARRYVGVCAPAGNKYVRPIDEMLCAAWNIVVE
jgi:hypothetical protein